MKINAVFEGGGVKGIALAGAVDTAQRIGFEFAQVAGTSSGAIIAALLAAGYTGEEMKRIILDMPFRNFLRRSPIYNMKFVGPAARLLIKKGLYSGEALEYWVAQKLADKGVRAFGDLPKGKLRIVASDISQGKLLVLPDDIAQYGIDSNRFLISKAVRMSASIPYFFDPVMIRKTIQPNAIREPSRFQYIYIVDGGLLSNFPLWLFDQSSDPGNMLPTIGFQLVGKMRRDIRRIGGPLSMLSALFVTMMGAHDERYIEEVNRFRTIKIPTLGVSLTDFGIAPERSLELFESGQQAARKFFTKWKHDEYEAEYAKYVLRISPERPAHSPVTTISSTAAATRVNIPPPKTPVSR